MNDVHGKPRILTTIKTLIDGSSALAEERVSADRIEEARNEKLLEEYVGEKATS